MTIIIVHLFKCCNLVGFWCTYTFGIFLFYATLYVLLQYIREENEENNMCLLHTLSLQTPSSLDNAWNGSVLPPFGKSGSITFLLWYCQNVYGTRASCSASTCGTVSQHLYKIHVCVPQIRTDSSDEDFFHYLPDPGEHIYHTCQHQAPGSLIF